MGKQSDPPPMYRDQSTNVVNGAATQLANNRLNTSNPFSSGTFNPGKYNPQSGRVEGAGYNVGFNGALGDTANSLTDQAAQNMATPFSFGQFGAVGTGDQARDQAITGAYGQATSRLNPVWDQRETATRTQLLNQGLDPSSEAFKNEMDSYGRNRNDAYSSAMNGAIAQGTAAGHTAFGDNMASRQQAIAEALRQRGMPMDEMHQLMGLTGQPQYNLDNSTLSGATGAASAANTYDASNTEAYRFQQQQKTDNTGAAVGGVGAVIGSILPYVIAAL